MLKGTAQMRLETVSNWRVLCSCFSWHREGCEANDYDKSSLA